MNQRGALLSMAVILGGLTSISTARAAAETYEIDSSHSTVIFRVEHLGVSNSYGRFNDVSGTVVFDADEPANSSVDVTIKAGTVDTNSEKRDNHLRGPDFLDVKQFPVITFSGKKAKRLGEGRYEVAGELMLHGVKKPLVVEIEHVGSGADPWGNDRAGFETRFTVKRSDFGINYMPDGLGQDVELWVSLEGIKK